MTTLRTSARQALEALQVTRRACFAESTLNKADAAMEALLAALAEPDELQCNPHPKAPHSFMRNASHNEDRYVCECEGWEPYEAGYQAGMEAALAEPVQDGFDQLIAEMEADPEGAQALEDGRRWVKEQFYAGAEPVQEQPICDECGRKKADGWALYCVDCLEPMFAQRKPLTVMELQDALIYTNLIDPDAVNDPEGYDEGSTLAQIDELHTRLTT